MKRFHLHNRFEDKLRYKVEDFELVPSDNIWDNIETELDAASKKKSKYVAVLVSAALLMSTAAGLYFGGVFDSSNSNIVAENTASGTNIPAQQEPTNNSLKGDNTNSIDANRTEPVNTASNTSSSTNNDFVFNTNRTNQPRVSLVTNTGTTASTDKPVNDLIDPTLVQAINRIKEVGYVSPELDYNENVVQGKPYKTPAAANTVAGANAEQIKLGLTKDQILANANTDEKDAKSNKNKTSKPNKTHKERITNMSVGLTFAPQYSYRKFNEYETSFRPIKDFRNRTDGSVFGYTFGADLYYHFQNSKVILGTGLYYTSMGENISVAYVDDNGTQKIIAAEDKRVRNTYNFVDIPLSLTVRLNENSRGPKLDLRGGIIYSKLTKVDALVYDYNKEEYNSVVAKDHADLNPSNISLMFGVNTVVNLDRHEKNRLAIGPMIRYNMLSTYADTYTAKQRNFNFGVQVSYIYRLDH